MPSGSVIDVLKECVMVLGDTSDKYVQTSKSSKANAAALQQLLVARKNDCNEIIQKLLGLSDECKDDLSQQESESQRLRADIENAKMTEVELKSHFESLVAQTKEQQERCEQLDQDRRACSAEQQRHADRAARRQLRLSLYKTILPTSFNQTSDGSIKGFVAGDKDIATFSFDGDVDPFSRTEQVWNLAHKVCAPH